MYLSKLELHGFKSFADRTVLEFDSGITSVVGPNGCGKSNIIDAVRWVLGAQRPTLLRSNKMENVIFNGTSERRALGMAEVELTIENTRNILPTEYSEVTVGRRLYRSGESEYLLNGVECRLKDIDDLFMDTGMGPDAYSVIELKMVDDILSNTGDSRRTLFEEAAGITKYKQRRKQALRKLESTQEDLTRVRDITSELETQVERLEKQADKAGKHKKYRRELRRLELQHAQCQFTDMDERVGQLRKQESQLEDDVQELTTTINGREAELEEKRAELTGREQHLAEHQHILNEHVDKIRQLESDRRLQKERKETAERGLQRLDEQQNEAAERRDSLEETREQLTSKIEDARPDVASAREALEEAAAAREEAQAAVNERRDALQQVKQKEQELAERRSAAESEADRLQNRIELLQEERERVQQQMESSSEKADVFADREDELESALESASMNVESCEEALRAAEEKGAHKRELLESAREDLQQLEREYDALAAEVRLLESLVSSYDEYGDTVKFLAESNWTDHDFQTVADLLGCDENDRLALHTALGAYRSCIVVETEQEAETAIDMLRSEDQGQATFLVLDRFDDARAPTEDGEPLSGTQPILDVVRPLEPRFAAVANTLLSNVFVTDTLDEARAAASTCSGADPRTRFVARTGEWVDVTGTIHGGGDPGEEAATAHRLGRREQLENTRAELQSKKSDVDEQTAAVERIEQDLEEIPLEDLQEALEEARADASEARQRLEQLSYEKRSLSERQEEQQQRLEEIEKSIDEYSSTLTEKREAVEVSARKLTSVREERQAAETVLTEAEAALQEASESYNDSRLEAVQVENTLENLEREKRHAEEGLQTLSEQAEKRAAESESLTQDIEEAREKSKELEENIQTAYEKRGELQSTVQELEEEVSQLRSSISDREKTLRELRQKREKKITEKNQRSQRLTKLETRLEDLQQRIAEEYEIDLEETEIAIDEEFSDEAAQKRIPTLRKKLRELGAVNELALENYEEEKERLEFMQSQQEDLEESEEKLLETIDEINTTATEQFTETFEAIQEHFSDLFQELFGTGAHAKIFIDGEHPLDDPVRITAKPRGKKPSTLAQLSGGEKALTAIALLFAIYLVKPSPFCILDEVDAPLDDANVTRFMRLIRRFADDTQFILVTHNKRTMEAADRLYGVTMQEQGVSTLVGVKFDEALDLVA